SPACASFVSYVGVDKSQISGIVRRLFAKRNSTRANHVRVDSRLLCSSSSNESTSNRTARYSLGRVYDAKRSERDFIRASSQRPNFRDIFRPEEIDHLLEERMSMKFIGLLIETGYKDEPDVDQDGKPLCRRSTAVHRARGRYPEWEQRTRELFKIYDRFDVNYTNKSGLTHFHVACEYGLVEVVEKFLDFGQDPNIFERCDSASPLSMAVRSGHKDVALLLLINGADPNLPNEKGFTILHFLCHGHYDVEPLKMLFEICDELNQPLQVDAKDKFGRTSLQWAVARILPNTVDVLLDHGADLSGFVFPAKSDFGKINEWYDVDCESRKVSGALLVVEHLEKRGYKLDRSDALTIMHFFAEFKLLEKLSNHLKYLNKEEEFESRSKMIEIRPNLSLHQLFRMRSDEAAKLVTVADYYELACSEKFNESITKLRKTCYLCLCEITSRRFFRRWALDPFMVMTRYRLPIVCCDIIIRNLMNKDLFHICLASAGQSTDYEREARSTCRKKTNFSSSTFMRIASECDNKIFRATPDVTSGRWQVYKATADSSRPPSLAPIKSNDVSRTKKNRSDEAHYKWYIRVNLEENTCRIDRNAQKSPHRLACCVGSRALDLQFLLTNEPAHVNTHAGTQCRCIVPIYTKWAIIVVQSGMTPSAKQSLVDMAPKYILEQFLESELLINITEHELVPEHIVLSPDEKEELLSRYKLKENQLMRIQQNDPVSRYFGLKRGQVVKIIRPSETAGRYISYRLVSHSEGFPESYKLSNFAEKQCSIIGTFCYKRYAPIMEHNSSQRLFSQSSVTVTNRPADLPGGQTKQPPAVFTVVSDVTELLLRNANPNVQCAQGWTPLHFIRREHCKNDLADMLFRLSDKKYQPVQVDARSKMGNTPLHVALHDGRKEVAEFLLKRGAGPNLTNRHGSTPLHTICRRIKDDLVTSFLKMNNDIQQIVEIDVQDKFGRTPLQWAVANLLTNTVDVLLDRGASLSNFAFLTESYFDKTWKPLEYDGYGKHVEKLRLVSSTLAIIDRLEKKGYEVDRSDALLDRWQDIGTSSTSVTPVESTTPPITTSSESTSTLESATESTSNPPVQPNTSNTAACRATCARRVAPRHRHACTFAHARICIELTHTRAQHVCQHRRASQRDCRQAAAAALHKYNAFVRARDLRNTQGWSTASLDDSDNEDEFLPMRMHSTSASSNMNNSITSNNTSMDGSIMTSSFSSKSSINNSHRQHKYRHTVDSDPSAETSQFHVRVSSIAVVLLHENILTTGMEGYGPTKASIKMMTSKAEEFFQKIHMFTASGYGNKDFERASKLFADACQLSHLRFPIPDLRPRYDRVPWWKRSIRPDYMTLHLTDAKAQTLFESRKPYLSRLEIQCRRVLVTYTEADSDVPLEIAKASSDKCERADGSLQNEDEGFGWPRIVVSIFPQHVGGPLEDSSEGELDSSLDDTLENAPRHQPSPFSSKKVIHESDTPHSRPQNQHDKDSSEQKESEELIIPGNRQEMNEFIEEGTRNVRIQLEIGLPCASVQIPSKHLYELIYNRLNTDLLLWEPSAPKRKSALPTDTNASLDIASTLLQESVYPKFSMCKSGIQYDSDSDSEEDGIFQSTTSRVTNKHRHNRLMKNGQSKVSITLTINQGLFTMFTPVRDSMQNVIPGQQGELVIRIEDATMFSVSSYKGDENLGYVCILGKEVTLYHCGINTIPSQAPPLRSINSIIPKHCHRTIYRSEPGANIAVNAIEKDMLSVAIKIQSAHETHRVKVVFFKLFILCKLYDIYVYYITYKISCVQTFRVAIGISQATLSHRGLGETANQLVRVASEEHEQKGVSGAVGGVLRQIPPTVVKPIILATEATSNVLGGMRSQLVPDARHEAAQKWRQDCHDVN
ncbi:unnamed protein product, partial [Trichogramma brassicae]